MGTAMSINLRVPDVTELKPRITVFGVGGAGGNAVNNMITSGLDGVEFVVANTDAQALASSCAERRVQMGTATTEGLGAGSKPDVGAAAAEEAMDELKAHLVGCHMVFITAGMGGGTGTGAAPVIARAAREEGKLTVGVVTKPFHFEGVRRMRTADAGIAELQKYVDTLIIIPNQNLFRVANEKTTFADAFAMADEVLRSGVSCITDLMVKEGLINLDFADVRAVMQGMGKAMMGTGESSGDKRAIEAAEAAISNPLLDETSMKGASGILISITGGSDMTLYEVDEAASRIREEVDGEANIILGATFDDELDGRIRVSVVATGLAPQAAVETKPQSEVRPAAASLSEQIENLDVSLPRPNGRHAPQPQPAIRQEAPGANNSGPRNYNDVTIEKLQPKQVAAPAPVQRPAQALGSGGQASFAPQPPLTAKRPVRRMPTIEELPIVAQNEIRAREAQRSGEQKKPGLLERLGVGRQRRDERPVREHEPQFVDSGAAQPNQVPAVRTAPAQNKEENQARPQPIQLSPVGNADYDESLEIPAFLKRHA